MKVLNLRCADGHDFEGWFASEQEFATQAESHAIACPLCGGTAISRMPSAPRLNVGRHSAPAPEATQGAAVTLQSEWLRALRHVMSSTEDVGDRFAEEARRIHYGEVEERGIRGRASSEDAEALREEGIAVMALTLPDALKGPIQ
ncbi:MAG: DUF1178 family protein [Caldimonas sp.]